MKLIKHNITVFFMITFIMNTAGCISGPPGIPDDPADEAEVTENAVQTGGHSIANINLAEPHVPVIDVPGVIIAEQVMEGDGELFPIGKIFIPPEFDKNVQLHEIREDLPVIAFHPFDIATLQGDGWNLARFKEMNIPKHGVVFAKTPESVIYTLYDEDHELIGSTESFTFPAEAGDYILRIDVFEAAYYIRIVVGEPRGWCNRIDRYHGGGEGLLVYDFETLLEIRALLEKDDRALADYFKIYCDREDGRRWECPCFIQSKADLQSFFSWLKLDRVRLPFSDKASLENIALRDSYADIYVRYVIDDMLFNFYINPGMYYNTGDSLEGIFDNGIAQWSVERLTTVDDINIYVHNITDHFEIPDFSNQPEDPRVIYLLSINGMYVEVDVSIACLDPETCENGFDRGSGHSCSGEWVDRQAALDGILQFEFKTLFQNP